MALPNASSSCDSNSNAIELRSISKAFDSNAVLRDLNLAVEAGEFIVVLGESGSGKSTLLRLIAGLELPDSGSVLLNGIDHTRSEPHRRNLSFVSQSATCYDHVSCEENLRLAMQLVPNSSEPARHKCKERKQHLIERLGLGSCLNLKPNQLSGGQLQRLAIARALLMERPIMLLDEPLAHLNESLRDPIRFLLRELHDELKQTWIYITHDSVEAMQLADRIAVLDQGIIQQVDTQDIVYDEPATRAVANLLCRPSIQWITAPIRSEGRMVSVGVRPNDWQIARAPEPSNESEDKLEVIDGELIGTVTVRWSKRVAEEIWMKVEANSNQQFIVTMPAHAAPRNNSFLPRSRLAVRTNILRFVEPSPSSPCTTQ